MPALPPQAQALEPAYNHENPQGKKSGWRQSISNWKLNNTQGDEETIIPLKSTKQNMQKLVGECAISATVHSNHY